MLPEWAKRAWMRYFVRIRFSHYADDFGRLERAYSVEDPWSMGSKAEEARFDWIDAVIRRESLAGSSVLELGSGEGHHTLRLLERFRTVDGVESSTRAVERARRRCPRARFLRAQFPLATEGLRPAYDLVLASEFLYYVRDLEAALAAMSRLGRHCLATLFWKQDRRLGPRLARLPGARREEFRHGDVSWGLYLWPGGAEGRGGKA